MDLARNRLVNQRIAGARCETPSEVVAWLGAVQAQDYLGALWAVGLRIRSAIESDVEQALAERAIVRTWPMRGTLHFVAAADVRWMLELLTPRVVAASAGRHRQLELDGETFARSGKLLEEALVGGRQLTRPAVYRILEAAGISTAGSRGLHILGHLAQTGLICFGARDGKQQTLALLDEWVPNAQRLTREESLAELARRYFTSHGPATVHDFAWWSGLTVADARSGLEMAKPGLLHEVLDGRAHYSPTPISTPDDPSPTAYLLPAFDEYTVAYKDRSATLDPAHARQVNAGGGILNPTVVVDGRVVGTWKRSLAKDSVVVTPLPFTALRKAGKRAVARAARQYAGFLERDCTCLEVR